VRHWICDQFWNYALDVMGHGHLLELVRRLHRKFGLDRCIKYRHTHQIIQSSVRVAAGPMALASCTVDKRTLPNLVWQLWRKVLIRFF
jgi:hypothetical protein